MYIFRWRHLESCPSLRKRLTSFCHDMYTCTCTCTNIQHTSTKVSSTCFFDTYCMYCAKWITEWPDFQFVFVQVSHTKCHPRAVCSLAIIHGMITHNPLCSGLLCGSPILSVWGCQPPATTCHHLPHPSSQHGQNSVLCCPVYECDVLYIYS